jgi:hypothetical protein
MTQPKINLTRLKQYLKDRSQAELVADIAELVQRFPAVKEYYQFKLDPQAETEIATKYKKTIADEFFPARGFGKARLSIAKKAISDYKKVCDNDAGRIDLMLFYVEQGVKFTLAYGDIDEAFYLSMEGMYEQALSTMKKSDLENTFKERSRKIVADTSGIGWGFHDTLHEIYEEILASR